MSLLTDYTCFSDFVIKDLLICLLILSTNARITYDVGIVDKGNFYAAHNFHKAPTSGTLHLLKWVWCSGLGLLELKLRSVLCNQGLTKTRLPTRPLCHKTSLCPYLV